MLKNYVYIWISIKICIVTAAMLTKVETFLECDK